MFDDLAFQQEHKVEVTIFRHAIGVGRGSRYWQRRLRRQPGGLLRGCISGDNPQAAISPWPRQRSL